MEILPSEYQHLKLSRDEKIFVRNILSNDCFGNFLVNVNPTMEKDDIVHILLTAEGIVIFKFFDNFSDASQFGEIMPFYVNNVHKNTVDIISGKLISNRALVGSDGKLKFPVAMVYVFPLLEKKDINVHKDAKMEKFIEENCLFKSEMQKVRSSLKEVVDHYCLTPIVSLSKEKMEICENNINSILQRIAPEYVTIRVAAVADEKIYAGADEELLVVTEDDLAVKAYRLDKDQINIINKMIKGEQLILACAGSGKSVLLIAKCFKAAKMNPDKQFLITCYNRNLRSLYRWFIDRAGFKEKNVTCLTFHALCKKLLKDNKFPTKANDFESWVTDAIARFNAGHIKERFYGIFIDEVQEFSTEWYKFCFNLLENKDSEEHIFIICGDKTQKIKSQQRHGRAPWNAGDGYPNYRGGNKNIRIEKNYRNCIEINEYINHYVSYAKQYLNTIQEDSEIDPDMFLRGKSVSHGYGVTLKKLRDKSNSGEAKMVYESIIYIHDSLGIPYDEIAVVMYNVRYRKKIEKWGSKIYDLESSLETILDKEDIPFRRMYSENDDWGSNYGDGDGVRLIKFASVLGLDFRAAIICGLMPFGDYNETKNPDWEEIKEDDNKFQEKLENAQNDIRYLYVACTRAKEVLHIILPESRSDSVYVKMLEDAGNIGGIE